MSLPSMPDLTRLLRASLMAAGVAALTVACSSDDSGAAGPEADAPEQRARDAASRSPADTVMAPPAASSPAQGDLPEAGSDGGPAPVVPFQGEAAPPAIQDGVVLRVLAEGHITPDGTMTMPAMEQDLVYLMARVETESGRPIAGESIKVTTDSKSQILLDDQVTDDYGYAAFTLYVREPGLAQFTLSAKGVETRFRVDVMSLEESPWLQGIQGEGITPWAALRDVDVRFGDSTLQTTFGDGVAALDGQRVKLSGYMMPMTPDMQQSVFLLSASPPQCFFHTPGGPTTIALVETHPDRTVGMTMDPLVVEGKLELVRDSDQGLVYRLVEAGRPRS